MGWRTTISSALASQTHRSGRVETAHTRMSEVGPVPKESGAEQGEGDGPFECSLALVVPAVREDRHERERVLRNIFNSCAQIASPRAKGCEHSLQVVLGTALVRTTRTVQECEGLADFVMATSWVNAKIDAEWNRL